MRTRVQLFVGTTLLAAGAITLVVGACGFPSPFLAGDADSATPGSETSTTDGPNETIDGQVPTGDGGVDADTGTTAGDCDACDCDRDGFLGIQCDGSDCDDRDPDRHPDAAPSNKVPVGHAGDWNCDN